MTMNGNGQPPTPWGYQIQASIYIPGEPTESAVQDFITLLQEQCPQADFIGVAVLTVPTDPTDQIAT